MSLKNNLMKKGANVSKIRAMMMKGLLRKIKSHYAEYANSTFENIIFSARFSPKEEGEMGVKTNGKIQWMIITPKIMDELKEMSPYKKDEELEVLFANFNFMNNTIEGFTKKIGGVEVKFIFNN